MTGAGRKKKADKESKWLAEIPTRLAADESDKVVPPQTRLVPRYFNRGRTYPARKPPTRTARIDRDAHTGSEAAN